MPPTRPAGTPPPSIPEPFGYRLKNKVLGPPLHSERLEHETLGNPTALAVFASDNLSSCAYATEEILRVLVAVRRPRRVHARHTDHDRAAGGARLPDPLVSPDDQGLSRRPVAPTSSPATTSVCCRPGGRRRPADRLRAHRRRVGRRRQRRPGLGVHRARAVQALDRHRLRGGHRLRQPRGTKESGKIFAVPTYFFIVNMFILIGVGIVRTGHARRSPQGPTRVSRAWSRSAPITATDC